MEIFVLYEEGIVGYTMQLQRVILIVAHYKLFNVGCLAYRAQLATSGLIRGSIGASVQLRAEVTAYTY